MPQCNLLRASANSGSALQDAVPAQKARGTLVAYLEAGESVESVASVGTQLAAGSSGGLDRVAPRASRGVVGGFRILQKPHLDAADVTRRGPFDATAPRRRRAGFTLIELMTVCAIIGILCVVAIPNFLRATSRAKRSSCISNQKNVVTQTILYSAELRITDAVIAVSTLIEAGYLPDAIGECPTSDLGDFDDYEVTIEAGDVTAIVCMVAVDDHHWDP